MKPRLLTQPQSHPREQGWVLLAFRLPREPSTPRIAVWRTLKRLGAAQLVDGLVALPLSPRTREQLEWVAQDIVEAHGEASIWTGRMTSASQERELAGRMSAAAAADYRALAEAAASALPQSPGQRRRTLARFRRELRRIRLRDHFPPPERELAERAIEELAAAVEEVVT